MNKFFSAIISILAWLFVGLIVSQFASAKIGVLVGFVAFVIVASLSSPRTETK